MYSTTTASSLPSLSVVDGQRVTVQKFSGQDYQLQAAPFARTPTQVQQIARDATTVSVLPTLEGDRVSMEVSYHVRVGDESVSYSSNVQGEIGQWIPLLGQSEAVATDSRIYRAGDVQDHLSVRVDRSR